MKDSVDDCGSNMQCTKAGSQSEIESVVVVNVSHLYNVDEYNPIETTKLSRMTTFCSFACIKNILLKINASKHVIVDVHDATSRAIEHNQSLHRSSHPLHRRIEHRK